MNTKLASEARTLSAARRKIVLFGLFGIGNLGNEATLWVTLHHLRRRLPAADVACVCDALPAFANEYGVVGLPFDPLRVRGAHYIPTRLLRSAYLATATLVTEPLRRRSAIRSFEGADQFVLVGTGALDDLGEAPWGMPTRLLRWSRVAQLSHASVHLLAVGAGPIHNAISRYLMARAVSNADVRSYRDDYSREYMARLGVRSEADKVVPDLVFAFPREWSPAWRNASSPPRVIGVGVMAYFGWNVVGARGREIYVGYVTKLAAFVRGLLDDGYHVRLLIGERRTDARTVQDLLEAIGPLASPERVVAADIQSVQDVLNEIMHTDIVVASRFHNLVSALALGRPVVSLGYSAKFEALMQEMGLDGYCQSIEDIDVDRLREQVRHLASRHAEVARTVTSKAEEYRLRLERLYDLTFGSGQPE